MESCDRAVEKVNTQLKKDYARKVEESGRDEYLKARVCDWVIDSCERIVRGVRTSNQELLENAIRNKMVASKISGSLK